MRFITTTRALACTVSLLPFAASPAETPERLDERVITATRTALLPEEINIPVLVIDREEIERSLITDTGDLLRRYAGLEIARNGGPGQLESLFVRGTNSDHTLVMIDGVRINPGTIGTPALQNIAPDLIERIEVVKGPRSALYGTDAIGGVVNIRTRAGARRGVSASVAGGRYGTGQGYFDGATKLGGRTTLGATVGFGRSDGFPTRTGDTVDRGYDNTSINLYGELAATDTLALRARGWHTEGNTEYSDFFLEPVDQDFRNAAYALEADYSPNERLSIRGNASWIEDDIEQNQADDFLQTRRGALDLQADLRVGARQELTFGALLTRENARSLSFGSGFDVDTDVDQFFLQDRIAAGRHDLLAAVAWTDHETFGSEVTWNAEYGVSVAAQTRLTLAAGTAFHAPDSTDRFGFGGNPDLDPESSRQFEVGLRQGFGSGHSVFASAFRNDIDDLINYVITDFATFDGRNENVESARIDGVELGYRFESTRWLLRAEASLQDPRDRDTDERLLRRARENYILAAQWRDGRVSLGADVLHAGNRYDFDFPANTRLAAYTLVNLTAGFAVSDAWSISARLDNAFDEAYELVRDFNTGGRSFLLATRFAFR